MDEPEIGYHPVLDTEPYSDEESQQRRKVFVENDDNLSETRRSLKQKSIHWNKQILIHNHMMKNIPECDIVVRSRFDTILSAKIDWSDMIRMSYEEDIPLGFNTMHYSKTFYMNQLRDMHEGAKYYINDALIIHPYGLWDCNLVDQLYKDKKLKGAEEGWYQVLSEPSGMYHKSWHGGAYLEAYWETVKDVDESLHN